MSKNDFDLSTSEAQNQGDSRLIQVYTKLKEQWTPELIAGQLKQDHLECSISHEAVYQYIYEDAPELKKYLPRSHRVRRKRKTGRANSVNRIPERVGIDQRPQQANDRIQFGHWEADTATRVALQG